MRLYYWWKAAAPDVSFDVGVEGCRREDIAVGCLVSSAACGLTVGDC